MRLLKLSLALLTLQTCSVCFYTYGQPDRYRMTKEDYVLKYKNDAINDMLRTGVPASITLAQGILESEFGNSELARKANNHFGIKCHNEWRGKKFFQDDDAKNECFRKYSSVLESFDDHSLFLRSRERYAFLFELEITDYKGWANGLKKAGYATNPDYANRLIRIIEDLNLHHHDSGGSRMPVTLADRNGTTPVTLRKKPVRHHSGSAKLNYRYSANNVPYVLAKPGDSYLSLAADNNIELWQVLKYNDADKNESPKEGDLIYVKPKRSRADQKVHIVAEGETLRIISQLYAVKLKKLYKFNKIKCGEEPVPGQPIKLR